MGFMKRLKEHREREKERRQEEAKERQKRLYSLIGEMENGQERVEADDLCEGEARLLEHYAQKHGYQEEAMLDGKNGPGKFRLILTKTPISEISQMLGIPQDNIALLRIELTNMVQCQYCQTAFDLNQHFRCPHCGGKPETQQPKKQV